MGGVHCVAEATFSLFIFPPLPSCRSAAGSQSESQAAVNSSFIVSLQTPNLTGSFGRRGRIESVHVEFAVPLTLRD